MNLWDILILLAVACIIFFALRAYRRDSFLKRLKN